MAKVVRVAVAVPMRQLFDYLITAEQSHVCVGGRVLVPFGPRKILGFVVAKQVQPEVAISKLKPLHAVIDTEPLWPKKLWKLLLWAAKYYHHPVGEVLYHALPAELRQAKPAAYSTEIQYSLTEQGQQVEPQQLNQAKRQQQCIELLEGASLTLSQLKEQGIGLASVKALLEKGWIQDHEITLKPSSWLYQGSAGAHLLNDEQKLAVEAVVQGMSAGKGQVWLLQGVTGSGKTEVYLQAMEPVLARGEQVFVLVPEIGLTPQTIRRFKDRFEVPILALHSGLTDKERMNAWMLSRDAGAAILIGTRSTIFTPAKKIGLMIVDEEHDLSFKQQDGFRYHARDLAVKRAMDEGFSLILGSATPSLESWENAHQGRYQKLLLTQRAGGAKMVQHQLIDLKAQRLHHGLSDSLLLAMKQVLAQGNQVLLFLNRRGFASALLCRECGWISACHRCHANLTYHQQQRRLQCHHCGAQQPVPYQCVSCGSTQIITQGLGTEQVEAAIERFFPNKKVLRIDRDSTRKKGQLEASLEAAAKGEYSILIGTQMLAKGHHFPQVTLVALLDVDGALFSADFRASERLAQLYIQVAGRAGRAALAGKVVLQTHQPEHPYIQNILAQVYDHFAKAALEERQQALLPPYAAMALFRAESTDEQAAELLLQVIAPYFTIETGVMAVGPVPAPLARRAGRYRFQLLLLAETRAQLHETLYQILPVIEKLPEARKARWSLDIDPQDLT